MDRRTIRPHQVAADDNFGTNGAPAQSSSAEAYITERSSESSSRSRTADGRISHDSKPRLSKEQQEMLEREFSSRPKPSTNLKKTYASNLGVSLDKVNNWFQNRRAKVKQEYKKQQSAYGSNGEDYTHEMEDEYNMIGEDNAYIDHTFYQNHDIGAPAHQVLLPNGTHVPADLPSNHLRRSPRHDSIGQTFDAPADQMTSTPRENRTFQTFFGFDALHDQSQLADLDSMAAFRQQFDDQTEARDPHVRHRQSVDDSLVHLHALSTEDLHNSLPGQMRLREWPSTMTASMQYQTPFAGSAAQWSRALLNGAHDHGQEHSQSGHADTASGAQCHSAHFLYQAQEEARAKVSALGTHRDIAAASTTFKPRRSIPAESDLLQQRQFYQLLGTNHCETASDGISLLPSSSHQAGHHHDVKLEEPIGTSGPDQHQRDLPTRPSMLPRQTSNLAQRRRQKPTALGVVPPRSVSYNSASPRSPSANGLGSPNDHTLRRIKSSTGVINGRVQKNVAPPVRSPLHFSFSEADSSDQESRQTSDVSMSMRNGEIRSPTTNGATTLIPSLDTGSTAHQSYNNMSINRGDIAEHLWPFIPSTDASTTDDSIFSRLPSTAGTVPSYLSSPQVPMDYAQMAGLNLHHQHGLPNLVVPQSAPAHCSSFQANFPMWPNQAVPNCITRPEMHQLYEAQVDPSYQQFLETPFMHASTAAPMQSGARHQASYSVPVNGPIQYKAETDQRTPTQQSVHSEQRPLQLQPQQARQNSQSQQQQSFVFSSQPEQTSASTTKHESLSPSQSKSPATSASKSPSQEFHFQSYVPKEPADAASLPPRKKSALPKNLTFCHTGVQDFISEESS